MLTSLLASRLDRSEGVAPRFFRLKSADDRSALEELLAGEPRVVVHDAFLEQAAELIDAREPRRALSREDVARAVAAWRGGLLAEELGVWVYYPWSRRLVHLLDEADFIELRTVRNLYKITHDEQAALASKRVGVVGLSVGQSVALTLATERVAGELRIADMDRLGLSNLNRIRSGVHGLGVHKTTLVAREIAELDPFLKVRRFDDGLTEANVDAFFLEGGRLDAIVDECDDLATKVMIRVRARALGIPVIMDTSDRGLIDVERFDNEPARPIFHGLTGELDPKSLRGLSMDERLPHLFKLNGATSSARMIASLVEIGVSIKTWPQLASAVVLGGAIAADTIRRILLEQISASGRYLVDLEAIVCAVPNDGEPPPLFATAPVTPDAAPLPAPAPTRAVVAPAHATLVRGPVADSANLLAIVKAASTAPSGGNRQPWRWLAKGERLWLCQDRTRAAALLDFQGTASYMALGAAVESAVLAAHARGLSVRVSPFPKDAPAGDVVALLELGPAAPSSESHAFDALAEQLYARCTNRRLGTRTPLGADRARALQRAAESVRGVRLALLESEAALTEIARVLGAGDRIRFLSKALHTEMIDEARWSKDDAERTRDGIDIDTLELGKKERAGLTLCKSWAAMQAIARFGGGEALERGVKRAIEASAAVGLLVVDGVTPRHFFDGGRALQRLWLTSTRDGLSLQPLSALPYLFARLLRGGGEELAPKQCQQLEVLRGEYERVLPVRREHGELLLFRLGEAPAPTTRALRRHVEDVLTFL